jgi:hypothetical protein
LCIVLSYLPFFQLEIEGRKETWQLELP